MSRRAGRSARGFIEAAPTMKAWVERGGLELPARRAEPRARHQHGYVWRGRRFKTGSGLFRAIERRYSLVGYSEHGTIFDRAQVRLVSHAKGKPTIIFARRVDDAGNHIIGDDPENVALNVPQPLKYHSRIKL